MPPSTELLLKVAQDELAFFRAQLRQNWVLTAHSAILALLSPPVLADVFGSHPDYPPRGSVWFQVMQPAALFVGIGLLFAWLSLFLQAFPAFEISSREQLDVTQSLLAIEREERLALIGSQPLALCSQQVQDLLVEIVRLRALDYIGTQAKRLNSIWTCKVRYQWFTTFWIVVFVLAYIWFIGVLGIYALHGKPIPALGAPIPGLGS
jgi:hypothetical protein